MASVLLGYTLKNLLRHFWRSFATVLGVGIGIAAVLGTVTVGDNVNANLNKVFTRASGEAALILAPSAQGRGYIALQGLQDVASRYSSITATLPTLEYFAVLKAEAETFRRPLVPGMQGGFMLSGQDTRHAERLAVKTTTGELPRAGSNGVAISQSFASREKVNIGDSLEFISSAGNFKLTVSGLLKTDGGIANLNAGQVGVVNIADLQQKTMLQGQVSYLGLVLDSTSNAETLRLKLENALPETMAVLYPAGRGMVSNGLIQNVQSGLQVLAATLMALAGFLAYNTFAAAVVERHREFALLRTLGFTQKQVLTMSYLEAGMVSILGIVLGIVLGIAIAAGITAFNAYLLEFPFSTLNIEWQKVGLACVVGSITTFVAASGPARSASRVAPMAATRRSVDAGEQKLPTHYGVIVLISGLGMAVIPWARDWALLGASLAMALVFVGIALVSPLLISPAVRLYQKPIKALLGKAGLLGLNSAQRTKARNGVAIGAVALGMGLTVGVGGLVTGINHSIQNWVETTIIGDMFVAAASPFPETFQTQVRQKYPQLSEVSAVGVRIARYQPETGRARNASIILTDPERYDPAKGTGKLQFLSGSAEESIAEFYQGGAVYASGTIADRFKVGIGDKVKLRTSAGWKDFKVLGVVVDYTSAGESFVMSSKDLSLFGGGSPELFVFTLKQGFDANTFGEQLKKDYPELYLDIQYNAIYKKSILDITQQFFGATYSLLALAVIVSALGVANTLGMNLAERMHEMAVLRALGLTRGDLRKSIFAEGILVVTLGTVLGVIAGVALSQVITASANSLTGYRVAPTYPVGLFAIAILASPLVGVLASFLPARRASKIQPAEALRTSHEV